MKKRSKKHWFLFFTSPIISPGSIRVLKHRNYRPRQEKMPHLNDLAAVKDRWSNKLRILVNILMIIGLVFSGLHFYKDEKQDSISSGFELREKPVLTLEKIDSAAKAVAMIFAAADTNQLAKILSPLTLEKRRPYFPQLIKHMPAFAADFKTRKLQLARARYAVYAFNNTRGQFVVEFCADSSGRWLLMNF